MPGVPAEPVVDLGVPKLEVDRRVRAGAPDEPDHLVGELGGGEQRHHHDATTEGDPETR